MSDISLKLKSDFVEIYYTLDMLSKDLYEPHLIEDTIWLYYNDDDVLGYIGYDIISKQFILTIAKGYTIIKKEFKTRNELIIYLKRDFISELTAGLI